MKRGEEYSMQRIKPKTMKPHERSRYKTGHRWSLNVTKELRSGH